MCGCSARRIERGFQVNRQLEQPIVRGDHSSFSPLVILKYSECKLINDQSSRLVNGPNEAPQVASIVWSRVNRNDSMFRRDSEAAKVSGTV